MIDWRLDERNAALIRDFGNLDAVFALEGERLSGDSVSEVIRIEREDARFYVKRCWKAGKRRLHPFLGRSRFETEWRNLQRFAKWGIATAEIVAYGKERRAGVFARGALITREIVGTRDLAQIARRQPERFADRAWRETVFRQLAAATRTLHDHHFAHNDLKWRNLLVDESGKLFLIDCPSGRFWWGPLLQYRIVKDLACLDKKARETLSRTQRLRFYLQYAGRDHLSRADKRCIRKVLDFFQEPGGPTQKRVF